MFAAGRIIRNRRESSINGVIGGGALSQFGQRPKKKPRKFRCYVPFVWQALLATGIGMVIIAVGTVMCVIGYHAGQFTGMTGRRGATWHEDSDVTGVGGFDRKGDVGVVLVEDENVTPVDSTDQVGHYI